jgi:hypothetical protein
MGLTKRKDSYYVAFSVIVSDDGKTFKLAPGVPGARLKRWKVGCLNKTIAREMESTIGLTFFKGRSLQKSLGQSYSVNGRSSMNLEEVRRLRSFSTQAIHVQPPFEVLPS